MKTTFALVAALAGMAMAQGVTEVISPTGAAPATCTGTYDGEFEVTVAKVVAKRDLAPLQKKSTCGGDGILVLTLADSILTDASDRTGYIASNYQFQFDEPPQAGAIYTAGFSVCSNNSLALGSSTVFYQCLSGDFWNLYDRNWAAQCEAVEIIAMPCGSDDSASQATDGQVVATEVVTTTIVKPLSDGQPQVLTTTVAVPMCQISDGQVQVVTTPCASITTTAAATTATAAPVSQYSDGQIQVTGPASTAAAASTTAAAASTTAAAATTVVLPSETVPVTSLATSVVSSNSTVSTAKVSASGSTATTATAAATTSAVAASRAGRLEMGSLAALVVGLVGAVAFL